MKTENNHPPTPEAVKAAFAYVDADTLAPSECIKSARLLAPFRKHDEPLDFAAARIMAAHARAKGAEVARLRDALEFYAGTKRPPEKGGGWDFKQEPDIFRGGVARKALTGEASE